MEKEVYFHGQRQLFRGPLDLLIAGHLDLQSVAVAILGAVLELLLDLQFSDLREGLVDQELEVQEGSPALAARLYLELERGVLH